MAIVVLVFFVQPLFASLPERLAHLVELSREALHQCNTPSGMVLASELEHFDVGLSTLYRLAWFQKISEIQQTRSSSLNQGELAWNFNGELWADEWNEILNSSRCAKTSRALKLELVPSDVLQKTSSLLSSSQKPSPNVLKAWISLELLKLLRKEPLGADPWPLSTLPPEVRCERTALRALSGASHENQTCPVKRTYLSALMDVWLGDRLLLSGRSQEALSFYERAFRQYPKGIPELSYRRAYALFAVKKKDQALRASFPLLEELKLSDRERTVLVAMACKSLSKESSQNIQKTLARVLEPNELLARSTYLLDQCSPDLFLRAGSLFLPWAKRDNEKIELLSKLFETAVKVERMETAQAFFFKLLAFSKSYPQRVSQKFWGAIENAPLAKNLAETFVRKNIHLADSSRFERWKRELGAFSPSWKGLNAEKETRVWSLDVEPVLPEISWPVEVSEDFIDLFQREVELKWQNSFLRS